MKKTLLLVFLLPTALLAQELGVYVPMWMMNPAYGDDHISPATMNWTKISWVAAFSIQIDTTKQPYTNILTGHFVNGVPTNGTDSAAFEYNYTATNWLGSLITNGHSHSAKILLAVDMVDPTGIKAVIRKGEDSVDLWARSLVAYANRKGSDGIDLNIESWITSPPTPTQISMLFRHLRYWMTTYAQSCSLITIAPGQGNSNVYQSDSVNYYVDKVHIQFYAYDPVWYDNPIRSNCSWYINPLRRGTGLPTAFEGKGIEDDLQSWVAAGYTKSKLEMGISTYVWVHQGIDSVMKPVSSSGYGTYQYAQSSLSKGGIAHWDNIRKATWIGGTATSAFGSGGTAVSNGQKFFITAPSDSNTYYVARYAIDSAYGGIWFYDLSMDHSESSNPKNPVINFAQNYLTSQSHPAFKGTFSTSSSSILANGTSTVTITVQAKDSTGVNITNGGDVISLSTTLGSLSSPVDHLNGTYTSTLTSSKVVGLALVNGTINGKPIGDTAKVNFRSLIDSHTTISASPSSITANGTSKSIITVQAKDTNGVNITTGGSTVTLLSTAGILSSISDNHNGTYTDTLTSSTTPGTATIIGTIDGATISNTASVVFAAPQGVTNRNGTDIPKNYELGQNYPNPFNPSTTIQYGLPTHSHVRLVVYDILGQVVSDLVNGEQVAGWNQVVWNASVSTGLYFYKLEAVSVDNPSKRFVEVKKMLLLK